MDTKSLGKSIAREVVQGVITFGPKVSPLDGVNPQGRVDVLASRLLERTVVTSCGPVARGLYPHLKPAIDDLIVNAVRMFGPKPTKPVKRARRKGARTK